MDLHFRKMRILVLSWRGPKHPLAGGAEQVMHEHMKGWVAAGHEVTLFRSSFKGGDENEVIDGVKIIRRGRQIFGVHIMAFFYYVLSRHEEYDLVMDQFHGIPFFTPLYVRGPKLAVVQEVAGRVWLKNELPRPMNWIVGWIGYLGDPLLYFFYRRVNFMTGSQSAKDDLVKVGINKERVTVVPHGVIVNALVKTPAKEKINTVMFLGAVTKDKGIEDVFEVFRRLNASGEYQFWVVGKASEAYIKEMQGIEKEMNKSSFQYWGFVSQRNKFELLARAHVMINPSILEGFGLVNIEASAMGTPVVAYKSRGLIDSVKDEESGVFCKENSPQEIVNEVEKLLGDSARYQKLSKDAVGWSKNFTWERSRKLSLELVNRIVAV